MSDLYYHYTDASTALKILSENELWLTHTEYLNDATEGAVLSDSLKKHIKTQEIFKLLDLIDSRTDAYTCSFSAEPDLLSQWRGYCPPNEGYAIGFKSPENFVNLFNKDGVLIKGAPVKGGDHYNLTTHTQHFVECIYDAEKQEKICAELAQKMESDFKLLQQQMPSELVSLVDSSQWNNDLHHRLKAADIWFSDYIYYKYLFKNESFKEEREFRFFLVFDRNYHQSPCYRTKNGVFIPYYRYCFPDSDIGKIVIRATVRQQECKRGLEKFLKLQKRVEDEKIDRLIELSSIPFK